MFRNLPFSHKCQANARFYNQSPQTFVQRAGTRAALWAAEVRAQTFRLPVSLKPLTTHAATKPSLTRTQLWLPGSHWYCLRESAGLQITQQSSGSHGRAVENSTPFVGEDVWIYNSCFFPVGN